MASEVEFPAGSRMASKKSPEREHVSNEVSNSLEQKKEPKYCLPKDIELLILPKVIPYPKPDCYIPKIRDIKRFKRAILLNDLRRVKYLIEKNPLYLISSTDKPVIVKEETQYTALHIAAKSNYVEIAKFLLSTVSDLNFLANVYGVSYPPLLEMRETLIDKFLNATEIIFGETPLHFACKYGAIEMVEVLTSYPECDKDKKNINKQKPADIVCMQATDNIRKDDIINLLINDYFVPILRTNDNSLPPIVGEPCLKKDIQGELPSNFIVRAFAGPMSFRNAVLFHKKLKNSPSLDNRQIDVTDPEKSCEKIGRLVALNLGVTWKEYWSFLDAFLDIASVEGLNALESYLRGRFKQEIRCQDSICDKFLLDDLSEEFNKVSIGQPAEPCAFMAGTEDSILHSWKNYISDSDTSLDLAIMHDASMFYAGYQHVVNPPQRRCANILEIEYVCKVFSSRIADAIIRRSQCVFLHEVCNLQHYLAMNSQRKCFEAISFRKCHYRIAVMTTFTIMSVTNFQCVIFPTLHDILKAAESFHMKYRRDFSKQIMDAGVCLVKYINAMLMTRVFPDSFVPMPNENTIELLWSLAESCDCKLPPMMVKMPLKMKWSDAGEVSYSFTSDEEDASELPSDRTPTIFLTGCGPARIDKLVFDALRFAHVRVEDFPNTVIWMKAIAERIVETPDVRWCYPGNVQN